MRTMLAIMALALALAGSALAQSTSLPDAEPRDPSNVLPDHRLEVVNKEMAYAAERLDQVAVTDTDSARQGAIDESRETVAEVRKLVGELPPDQQAPYEEALQQAERALDGGDLRASAAAMRSLRERVLQLVAQRD